MTYRSTLQILNSIIQPIRWINLGKALNREFSFIEEVQKLRQYLILTY